MRVKLWGVRGSLPAPVSAEAISRKIEMAIWKARNLKLHRSANAKYDQSQKKIIDDFLSSLSLDERGTVGGNTPCVQIMPADDKVIIVDCGSGLRSLGEELMRGDMKKGNGTASIFISHTHWDHICGLPFFTPIYIKGNCFDFYSGFRDLEARLCDQHHPWHFPVPWEGLNSTRKIHLLSEARSISIGNTRVKMMELSHPGKSFGFRFEDKNGRVVIYSSDAEFKSKQNNNIEKYIGFFKDADILIFDTQYTPGETLTKEDWGHSSVIVGTEIAIQAGVKNLLMFHYDPAYNDEKIVNLYQRAQQHREILSQHSSDVKIHIGYEGMTIEV